MNHLETLSKDELLVLLADLLKINAEQQERIAQLEAEAARRRSGSPPSPPAVGSARAVPAFVKSNRPAKEKRPRKPRKHSFARHREKPTHVIEHFPEQCRCGRRLTGGWVHQSRQIIDIPVSPVEVVEHRLMACRCGVCGRRTVAHPDLSSLALGKSRFGVRVMSLIGYLDTACRMPVRTIQQFLQSVYRLRISIGEIIQVLHRMASEGRPSYNRLLSAIRHSGVVHADETGGREAGRNGYVWSLCTPSLRFYHRDASRGAAVIQKLLGYAPEEFTARSGRGVIEAREKQRKEPAEQEFRGVLVSDFYGGYRWYGATGGWHQCCLVHLDRDLDALKAEHPHSPGVCQWVDAAIDLIERAKAQSKEEAGKPPSVRRKLRQAFEREALELARPYCRSDLPQSVLAERIAKHRGELFVFVEHPDVPPDNNAAERAIRPYVVLRKVSGGTRSKPGSDTQMILLSLFGTWSLRGIDLLAACQSLLAGKPLPATT